MNTEVLEAWLALSPIRRLASNLRIWAAINDDRFALDIRIQVDVYEVSIDTSERDQSWHEGFNEKYTDQHAALEALQKHFNNIYITYLWRYTNAHARFV